MKKSILTRALCLFLSLLPLLTTACSAVRPSERETDLRTDAPPPAQTPDPNAPLTIHILNTGKSDCCVIFYEEYTLFIDTADGDDYAAIRQVLDDRGRTIVDLMILTHYDNDHIGSAGELIRNFDVKAVIGPDYVRKSLPMVALSENLDAKGGELQKINENVEYTFGALSVLVSAPNRNDYSDENDYSLITTLKLGEKKLLFLGDACNDRLTEFYRDAEPSYDFVKFPHHGDYEGAMASIFMTCSFGSAVLCEAQKEDSRLTALLETYSVRTFRTYDGPVTVTSDGTNLSVWQ